jgi:hypothetical protein
MFKQFKRKKLKIFRGWYHTRISKKWITKYDENQWWDTCFYLNELNDNETIDKKKSQVSTKYHYASIELILLRFFLITKLNFQASPF